MSREAEPGLGLTGGVTVGVFWRASLLVAAAILMRGTKGLSGEYYAMEITAAMANTWVVRASCSELDAVVSWRSTIKLVMDQRRSRLVLIGLGIVLYSWAEYVSHVVRPLFSALGLGGGRVRKGASLSRLAQAFAAIRLGPS